ncbi:MAG: ribonuclease H-like domain-containing protein [Ignavibacteriales bacterium]|nr:ribonuclease H-like domain-containing protein [Ignavibacteriales bacterium]
MQLELFTTEVYYDLETQRSAGEVGWDNIQLMRLALGVTWSFNEGFLQWDESKAPDLIRYLASFDKIISFNGDGFDSRVLSFYGNVTPMLRKSFDLLVDLKQRLGHRLSLESLARATLQVGKSATGLQSLQWWKEGKVDLIAEYCRQDVKVLVELVAFGRANGFVHYLDKNGLLFTVKVQW